MMSNKITYLLIQFCVVIFVCVQTKLYITFITTYWDNVFLFFFSAFVLEL